MRGRFSYGIHMFAILGIDFSAWLAPMGVGLLVVSFVAILIASWCLTLLGLPGNWIILAAAIGLDFVLKNPSRLEMTLPVVIALGVLAIIGELFEFLAGSLGVAKKGGSRLLSLIHI